MSGKWVTFLKDFLTTFDVTGRIAKSKEPSWKETHKEFKESLRVLQEKIAKVSRMIDDKVFEEVDAYVPSSRDTASRGYGPKNSQKSF